MKQPCSIAFIKKAFYHDVIPACAKVKGEFLGNTTIKKIAQKKFMKGHFNQHYNDLKELTTTYHSTVKTVHSKIGDLFTKLLTSELQKLLKTSDIESFKTKNINLRNLIKLTDTTSTKYAVPIINLSSYHNNQKEYEQLKFG